MSGFKSDLARRLKLGSEIVGWQLATKIVSIFAFAHAARCLGPEKFGISGVVLSVVWQAVAVSGLLNEAFLSRRYRRAQSRGARRRVVTAATVGRFSLAILTCAPAVSIGLALAPSREWWFAIWIAAPFLIFVFLQPNWILVGRDATNLIWRAAGLGSLVTSGFLFTLAPDTAPAGIDILALALGAAVTMVAGWFLVARMSGGLRPSLSRRHFRMAWGIVRKGRWLFLTYLFSSMYLYTDTFLLGVFGTSVEAGTYRPASNLATSLYQSAAFLPMLLYPKFLDWAKSPELLWKRQVQLGVAVLAMVLVGVGVAALTARPIFHAMYGNDYVAASGPFVVLIAARGMAITSFLFIWGLISSDEDRTVGLVYAAAAGATVVTTLLLIPRLGIWGPALGGFCGDALILVASVFLSWNRCRKAL